MCCRTNSCVCALTGMVAVQSIGVHHFHAYTSIGNVRHASWHLPTSSTLLQLLPCSACCTSACNASRLQVCHALPFTLE